MLEYKGYHAEVQYSDEDGFFVGHVFGLADSLGFHGSSVAEPMPCEPLPRAVRNPSGTSLRS